MSSEKIERYKLKCKDYLVTIDIHRLRAYGRSIGVDRPAAKNKEDLIEDILAILAFELAPVERSKRGAPVKNDVVDDRIPAKMAEIKAECFAGDVMIDIPKFDLKKEYNELRKRMGGSSWTFEVNDPGKGKTGLVSKIISRGQVSYVDGEWLLYRQDGSIPENKIPIPVELVEKHKLRDGDFITCNFYEQGDFQRVEVITSINGVILQCLKEDRRNFNDCAACYSKERIKLFSQRYSSVANKCIDWLVPLSYGQRACVVSTPKAGKTRMILQLAEAVSSLNRGLEVIVLLVDQTHETVGEFRREFGDKGLIYTTYEDDVDRQVYVADWALQRAKRYAEMGKNVVFFIDSLTALARAYNDTEDSMGGKTLPCGLEVKTIHYLKRYFGTARCLEEGGSITMFGSLSIETGNPMDDIIARELSEFSTLKVELSDELAIKRIYPALDVEKTYGKYNEMLKTEAETKMEMLLRNNVLPHVGLEGAFNIFEQAQDKEEFERAINKLTK